MLESKWVGDVERQEINCVRELKEAKKRDYLGISQPQLRDDAHRLIQNHKYVIYVLSVIRFHIGNQTNAAAIRKTDMSQFELTPSDMLVSDSEIDLLLKNPLFCVRWSKTNYGFWVKKFTSGLGPLSMLKRRYMYSLSRQNCAFYDTSEELEYISPLFHGFKDKFNTKIRRRRFIKWNQQPEYDVQVYFDMYFAETVNEHLLRDFMDCNDWKIHVHPNCDSFMEGISAIVTGYYKNGKCNCYIEAQLNLAEEQSLFKLKGKKPRENLVSSIHNRLTTAPSAKRCQSNNSDHKHRTAIMPPPLLSNNRLFGSIDINASRHVTSQSNKI